jgi:hypothetical protein
MTDTKGTGASILKAIPVINTLLTRSPPLPTFDPLSINLRHALLKGKKFGALTAKLTQVVVYSKPHKASFQSKISRTGGWTSLSRSTSFATSSGDDVTKFLADKIAEDIYQILDQNK